MIIITLFITCYSIKINELTTSSSSPPQLIYTSSVFIPSKNRIVVFGGEKSSGSFSSSLYYFDLSTSTWGEYDCSSLDPPPGLSQSHLFLTPDSKLLLLFGKTSKGLSSSIFSFDFNSKSWSRANLTGDSIQASVGSSSCSYNFNGNKFFAIFGGITSNGLTDELYIIDASSLQVRLMKSIENKPSKKAYASLSYNQGALYLIGGSFEPEKVYKFDLNDETWIYVGEIEGLDRENHLAFGFKDSIFLAFGFGSDGMYDSLVGIQIEALQVRKEFKAQSFLHGSSCLVLGKAVYFVLGLKRQGFNQIMRFDLDKFGFEDLDMESMQPRARKNHESFVFGHSLYVYGGADENGNCFSDLWKYDLDKNLWTEVPLNGKIPKGKESMGSVNLEGFGFVTIGGSCKSEVSKDNFFYIYDQSIWIENIVNSGYLTQRKSLCAFYINFDIIIIGGKDSDHAYGDIIIYNYPKGTYYEAKTIKPFPKELVNHKCFLKKEGKDNFIYIIGATDFNNIPYSSIFKVNLTIDEIDPSNTRYELCDTYYENKLNLYDFSAILDRDLIYLIGGRTLSGKINRNLIVFDIQKTEFRFNALPSELWIYGHSIVHIDDSFFIFGGISSTFGFDVSRSVSNSLVRVSFDERDFYSISCVGGVVDGFRNCSACPAGTYLFNDECKKCETGTYSSSIGATIQTQCLPCKYGEFNDKYGASHCKKCPTDSECPIGTSTPKVSKLKLHSSSSQPENYKKNNAKVNYLVYKLMTISFIISILCIIFVIVLKCCRELTLKLDLFSSSHEQKLEEPVLYKKTIAGGLFSISFICFAFSSLVTAFYIFLNNNITEYKTLVPLVTIKEEVQATNIDIIIIYHLFKGECLDQTSPNKCPSSLVISFDPSDSTFTYFCEEGPDHCKLTLKSASFTLFSDKQISILNGLHDGRCSFISVDISVPSSIPNSKSKVFVPIYPKKPDEVFKGLLPSKFNFEFIPSFFNSDSNDFPKNLSGFHILDLNNHIQGSTLSQERIFSEASISITLNLKLSTSSLVTKRNIDTSPLIFTENLLGSIFGLMGIFAAFISCSETFVGFLSRFKKIQVKPIKKSKIITRIFNSFEQSGQGKEKTVDFTLEE